MLATSVRLLELLSQLQARREWSGPELAERLDVGVRTVRRDVARLRRLGYPVDATPGVAGGYRLAPGASLPPLLLDDEEAIAIAVGLRTAARTSVTGIEETSVRALVKLEQVLPSHLQRRVSALGATTVALPAGGPTVDPQTLMVIAVAARDAERLRFAYGSRDGAESSRHVEPHSLVNLGRRWYLVAWDCDRTDWRTFRVDRLSSPLTTGVGFVGRTLPAANAADYVSRSISTAPHRYEARLTVHAAAATIRERFSSRWGRFEPIDADTCEYRTGDDDLEWLALRIAMLGVDFEIHEPPELIEHMAAMAERLTRAARRG